MGLVRKLIITSVFFNRQSSGTGIWQLERRRMSEFIILLVTTMCFFTSLNQCSVQFHHLLY